MGIERHDAENQEPWAMIVPTERIGRVKNVDRGHSIGVNKPKNTMEMVKLMKVVVMGREGARERSISGDVGRQVGSEGRGKQKDGAGDGRGVVGACDRFDRGAGDGRGVVGAHHPNDGAGDGRGVDAAPHRFDPSGFYFCPFSFPTLLCSFSCLL